MRAGSVGKARSERPMEKVCFGVGFGASERGDAVGVNGVDRLS
jgi:hypothetical protein